MGFGLYYKHDGKFDFVAWFERETELLRHLLDSRAVFERPGVNIHTFEMTKEQGGDEHPFKYREIAVPSWDEIGKRLSNS